MNMLEGKSKMYCFCLGKKIFHFSSWSAQSSASLLSMTFAEPTNLGNMVQNGNAQWP